VYLDKFVLALDDASSKVAREAVLALSKKANSSGGQRLWEIYDRCCYPHGKRWTLVLLDPNQQVEQHRLPHSITDGSERFLRAGEPRIDCPMVCQI
jgi:hypothetical protein